MTIPDTSLDAAARAVLEEETALAARLDDALRALGASPPLSRVAPYFGHLRIERDGRRRDLLIGERTWLDGGPGVPPVLGWRSAPLARVFLLHKEGEPFEEEVDERVLEGRVLVRRMVGFREGALEWIAAPGLRLERGPGGWRRSDAPLIPELQPLPGPWAHPERREALDPDQRAVLDRAPDGPALILGAAGSGKTTVALHRLRMGGGGGGRGRGRGRDRKGPKRLVIVPEPGLADLARTRLARLGLPRVPVQAFDDWVIGRGRAVLGGLVKKVVRDAPPAVMRLKRHPALRPVLARYVEAHLEEVAAELDHVLVGRGSLALALAEQKGRPPLTRLDALRGRLERDWPHRREEVRRAFIRARAALLDLGQDRIRIFGDRVWVQQVADGSGGEVWPGDVEATLGRVRRQLDEASETAYSGMDSERLQTLDGRALDADTPAHLAGTVDVEDLPVLLDLLYLKTGRGPMGDDRPYDHILVDEVQDVAPVELAALARSVRSGGRLTASGDDAQHLDPTAPQPSWEAMGEVLGVGPERRFKLHYSHRCPAPILGFAREVMGGGDLADMETRVGPPVRLTRVSSQGQGAAVLIDALGALLARPDHGEVAVICRDDVSAREIHRALEPAMDARLVLEGAFPFTPGLVVTEVRAVRGLEFDVVVVPDAGAARYPATAEAAAALHLAATRSRHQLWVVAPGMASPLLPPDEPPGP